MSTIIDNKFLSKKSKQAIRNIILGLNFPFYHRTKVLTNNNNYYGYLEHTILVPGEKDWNSNAHVIGEGILNDFIKKHKLSFKKIHRMAINLTYNNGTVKCPVHNDHEFPHKQLIVYLNPVQDISSKLVLLDKNNKEKKSILPKQFRGVCFDSCSHYHYYPKFGERIAFVCTFE